MPRYARYQLTLEQQKTLNQGEPIPLHTFGGYRPVVTAKSLRNTNTAAFEDHLFELMVDGNRLLLSASELTQVLQTV